MIFQIHVAKCVWNFLSFRRWKCWWRRKKWDWRHHPGLKHGGKKDSCMFLVVWWMCIIKKIIQKYNNHREKRMIAEIWSCTGSCAQFYMLSFTYLFIYNNTFRICLCFKAKGHGTRMTSEEQSLKWWGFLQDEMRFLCHITNFILPRLHLYVYHINELLSFHCRHIFNYTKNFPGYTILIPKYDI